MWAHLTCRFLRAFTRLFTTFGKLWDGRHEQRGEYKPGEILSNCFFAFSLQIDTITTLLVNYAKTYTNVTVQGQYQVLLGLCSSLYNLKIYESCISFSSRLQNLKSRGQNVLNGEQWYQRPCLKSLSAESFRAEQHAAVQHPPQRISNKTGWPSRYTL